LPAGTLEPKEGPDHVVRLESSNIPAFQEEEYMPPENELKSRVDFYYSDETPEPDQNKFWKGVGKKLNGKAEGFGGKRKDMEAAVAQIVLPGDTPEVKAQKIYARVQQMKNLSYAARKTEEESKRDKDKNLSNADEMWKRNEGYGYGLTWLYLSLVRAAGIEAYPAMVSDREQLFLYTGTDGQGQAGCERGVAEAEWKRCLLRSGSGVYAVWTFALAGDRSEGVEAG